MAGYIHRVGMTVGLGWASHCLLLNLRVYSGYNTYVILAGKN